MQCDQHRSDHSPFHIQCYHISTGKRPFASLTNHQNICDCMRKRSGKYYLLFLKHQIRKNHHNNPTDAETFFLSLHLSLFFYRTTGATQPHIVTQNKDNHKITPLFFFNSHASLLAPPLVHDHSQSSFTIRHTMEYSIYTIQVMLLYDIIFSNILQT